MDFVKLCQLLQILASHMYLSRIQFIGHGGKVEKYGFYQCFK